ncbi:MAG TPA: hypothetical protein PK777_01500, partial [Thermoguttaceae bacterium]|nr:hypothetical protein [Thermoguttaceae bacterium]
MPTIGAGNVIGGRAASPRELPVWSSSTLMTAAMPPGPISSIGSLDYRHDEWGVDVTVGGSQ